MTGRTKRGEKKRLNTTCEERGGKLRITPPQWGCGEWGDKKDGGTASTSVETGWRTGEGNGKSGLSSENIRGRKRGELGR